MNTTVCDNGTVQFFHFLVMRGDIIIITNCDLLIVILEPYLFFSLLKLENGLTKYFRNVA